MRSKDALRIAREVLEANLEANNTPARKDIEQLKDSYPMQHAIKVLRNLEELFDV